MILDQAELDALSGFDERFFLYYEDQDISRRYAAAGLPVATTDAIRATHDVGGSTSADRTVPHAWAFLALVQYVWIWNGERAGRASALGVVWGIRAQRALFRVFRRSPRVGATARRKDKELSALLEALGALATGTGAESGFCPEARRTVRRLVRP
jgi:GT2 family glycosyltransferase